MNDRFDVDLEDDQLMVEIDLVTELMIAAAESAGHLEQTRIDSILGVGGQ